MTKIDFYTFLAINALSISIILLGILAIIFKNKPINKIIGFHSELSTTNQETWRYGNLTSGKFCIFYGIILFVLGQIMKIFISNSKIISYIIVFIYIVSFPYLKFYVNSKIKKKFF